MDQYKVLKNFVMSWLLKFLLDSNVQRRDLSHSYKKNPIFTTNSSAGNNIRVKRRFAFDRNQYWVTELTEEIKAGTTVVLHLEFEGSLVNGIVGFYKSTYINTQTGIKR